MEDSGTKYLRKAVYTGRRLSGSKVFHRFELLPSATVLYFAGVNRVRIGHTYKCAAGSISSKPEMTDDARVDNPQWEAADALVDVRNAQRRAATKIQKLTKPALRAALDALRPLCEDMGFYERRELIGFLAEELGKRRK